MQKSKSATTSAQTLPYAEDEPQVTVALSFRQVHDYIARTLMPMCRLHDLTMEDAQLLFEAVLLSYFSRGSQSPSRLLTHWIEQECRPADYFDGQTAELIMAIMDAVAVVTNQHFPTASRGNLLEFYSNSGSLAECLQITDMQFKAPHKVILKFPARIFKHLNHAADSSRSSHRS